jgi:hypothetical protein
MHRIIVGEFVTSFSDSFETDEGWTVVNDPYVTAGEWERGLPLGRGDRGDPATDFDGSGSCFLTDGSDGDTDVEGGVTSLISPQFDLGGKTAVISYARWYSNYSGTNPFEDVMEVMISSNGGDDWVLVETVGPETDATGGWNVHEFFVDEFVQPTDKVQVRFDVSDLGGGSIVEAAVDRFSVDFVQCYPPYLCGDPDGSSVIDIDDVVYLISYIFSGGPSPDPTPSGDPDCSGGCDIDDVVYLILYIFSGGNTPCDTDGDGEPDC